VTKSHLSTATLGLLLFLSPLTAHAQMEFHLSRIDTPPQPAAIPLFPPGELPPGKMPERWGMLSAQLDPQTHIEARIARNVSQPTMTPVLPPADKANGTAVVIAPGGAFLSLSIDHEGYAVAQRLVERGIAAFVLKYRTNETPDDEDAFMQTVAQTMGAAAAGDEASISEPRAPVDALQALRLVRARAAEWHVDAQRVGIIGFSAGAMTGLQAVLTGKAADMPAFLGYVYGPMRAIDVPAYAPPMFAAIAMDDGLFARQGFGIVAAWRTAGHPVELHAYERGDHGFGTGRPGTTTTMMLDEFVAWLGTHYPSR
jgi:acetyl esterase/lipase